MEQIREFDEKIKLDREKLNLDREKHKDDVTLKRKALDKKPTTNTKQYEEDKRYYYICRRASG